MAKNKDSFPVQPGYSRSTIGAGTGFQNEGFDTSKYGHGDSSSGGTYSWEISLSLLFWDEMRRYQNAIDPPTFDGGIVKEKPSKGKCKVKLVGLNKEVMADSGHGGNIKKGMYALILCKKNDVYVIISAKNFAGMADEDSSEYSV